MCPETQRPARIPNQESFCSATSQNDAPECFDLSPVCWGSRSRQEKTLHLVSRKNINTRCGQVVGDIGFYFTW